MTDPIVIVGAGQAAASFMARHVSLGDKQPIVLIGDESHAPYQRPPLSKAYLLGDVGLDRLYIRPPEWYAEQGIETRYDTRVTEIRPSDHEVVTDGGETVRYSKLLLSTGARARSLPDAMGGQLDGVYTIRKIADIYQLKERFTQGSRLLIVGGGYIGLEAASVARKIGLDVLLIEMSERILQRVASEQTSDYFRKLHEHHDVVIRESECLRRLIGNDGVVCAAELESGEEIAVDAVLVGIGGAPNTELAEAAGLVCENGIAVDETCRTSDADIYAAGDCVSFLRNGQRIRLESVQNASDQGNLVARVLAGEDVTYSATPWFWSEQYDCMLQIVGLSQGHDQVVTREGAKAESCSFWYFREGRLLAVDAMNDARSYAGARRMLDKGLQPTPEQVADPDTDLKQLIKSLS